MMKKKWIAAGIAAAIIAVVLGASWWLSRGEGTTGAKEIEIIVVDRSGAQEEEVLRTSVHTDAQILTQLLEQEELQAEIEQSTYGSLLTSIGGLDQDMENGPWLVFESENNPSCKDAGGMCPAMDEVRIADGDRFTFALIAGF